jgi:hypothetical protein
MGNLRLAKIVKGILMKKLMVLSLIVFVVVVVYGAVPGNTSQGLCVELNIRKSFATNKNVATVILVNKGDAPIVVLSGGLGQGISSSTPDRKSASLELQLDDVEWNGHKLVRSHCAFSPVTLEPGEATLYGFLKEPFTNPFKRLKDTTETVFVNYTISGEDGKRYGVWSGTATSKVYKVVGGEIQNEIVDK